jgi:mannose-6-phosphate isomerase
MYRLDNPIRHYPWGSRTAIATLTGRKAPAPEPEAELWLGAHPSAPSRAQVDGQWRDLDGLIDTEAERLLSHEVADRFDRKLPFLLKILAAAEPLSIQTHPDAATARAGFAREESQRVPPERRNYRDSHHKPELLYAVTPFAALCGLRDPEEAGALIGALAVPALNPLLERLATASSATEALRAAFIWLLNTADAAPLVTEAAAASSRLTAAASASRRAAFETVSLLAERYPHDPGAVISLLMNRVDLAPGEAIHLGAGTLHAYLGGVGLELMASSDNVIRAGCTSKHIDTEELMRVARFDSQPPTTVAPSHPNAGETLWAPPVEELQLTRTEVTDSREAALSGPEIWLCLSGDAVLRSPSYPELELTRGQSAFVAADAGAVTVTGRGTLYRAAVGERPSSGPPL